MWIDMEQTVHCASVGLGSSFLQRRHGFGGTTTDLAGGGGGEAV